MKLGRLIIFQNPLEPEIVRVRGANTTGFVCRSSRGRTVAQGKPGNVGSNPGRLHVGHFRPALLGQSCRLSKGRPFAGFMEGMVEELNIQPEKSWQMNLTATLSQVGLVALPPEEMNKYATGQGVSIKFLSAFKAQAEIGGRALKKIPRLETVAKIIEDQLKPLPKKRIIQRIFPNGMTIYWGGNCCGFDRF